MSRCPPTRGRRLNHTQNLWLKVFNDVKYLQIQQMSIYEYSGMTRAEMLLKVVMSSLEPASAFVEQYVRFVQGEIILFSWF